MNQLFQETMNSFFEGLMRDVDGMVESILPQALAVGCGVSVTATWGPTSVSIEAKVDPSVAEAGAVRYGLDWD